MTSSLDCNQIAPNKQFNWGLHWVFMVFISRMALNSTIFIPEYCGTILSLNIVGLHCLCMLCYQSNLGIYSICN